MKYNNVGNEPIARSCITHPWVYWDDWFNTEEIDRIVEYAEQFDFSLGTTFGSEDPEEIKKVRKSNIVWLKPENNSQWIFNRVNHLFQTVNDRYYGMNLNGYESMQYTTYKSEENGNYDWHMDMNTGGYVGYGETRKLSMTLLLNDDFKGGEFEINTGKQDSPIVPDLRKGRAIFFPSYLIHRVKPITQGTRKSLVVWCLGPKFE